MKRFFAMLTAAALLLALAACSNQAGTSSGSASGKSSAVSSETSDKVEGDLQSLLAKVTEGVTDPEISLVDAEVTDENFSWYFFIDPIEGAEAAVSEPMIGAIPHFLGLLRVPEGTDAEQVRADIEANADPRKWVCVDAEKTAVLRRGDLILFVMSEASAVDKAVSNFNAL